MAATIGELLLGIEGLALLRDAFSGDAEARRTRLAEIRRVLESIDQGSELARPFDAPELALGEGYRRWSETYDSPLRLFPLEEPVMHALLDPLPPSTILDAACGTARHGAYLARRGHRVIGIDQSAEMLLRAQAKLGAGNAVRGDLGRLPLPDSSVDAAVCGLALVHLPAIDHAVAELARVVKPGGRVVLSDVHPFLIILGWQAQFRDKDGRAAFMRIHAHLPSDYTKAFEAAGLRIRGCFEPRLTDDSAQTVAKDRLPEANHRAYVGLPGVIVWDLKKA
ncbi:MAG: methyltransferase domain-containing protein [Alphaproteobacteria bacterium]